MIFSGLNPDDSNCRDFNLRVGCLGQCLSNVNHMYVTLNVFQYFELNMVMGNDV